MKKNIKLLLLLTALLLCTALYCGCGAKEPAEEPASVTPELNTAHSNESTETEPVAQQEGEPAAVPELHTTDIYGSPVDGGIFEGKDLTVVNVWGTFCTPCINEMPELAAWAKELPENVQLIGVVIDIDGESDTAHIELARKIAEQAGIEFRNLLPCEDMDFLYNIVGVPTTFFLDGEGNEVGDSILGANVPAYKAFVEEYLDALG